MSEMLIPVATEWQTINSLRLIANQMISKAGSGHPGIALGAAPILYELYANQLVVDPQNADMINRDRFVLSAGHGAALLYATLHIAGFNLSSDDLAQFRMPHSKTPGHPEVGVTPGVEATTGPLGQGLGMAVGMAMAEAKLHEQFPNVIDHFTYSLVGDGDLMEGVSHETASLAGQQSLAKLIVLYDDNHVSLDGKKSRSDISDNKARFLSYGWDVQEVTDGNNLTAIHAAIEKAKLTPKPTFIAVKTIIGDYGPFAGTNKAHGTPLNPVQLEELSVQLNTTIHDFAVPQPILKDMRDRINRRLAQQKKPKASALAAYEAFTRNQVTQTPILTEMEKDQAGRKISKIVLQSFAQQLPQLWGGSADLVTSTNSEIVDASLFDKEHRAGKNIAFGVREFGMGAVMNGIALHGGTKIFGSTFLAFSDYMKAAIRLSALQKVPVIYVFTHDSITVGEDGPTHQPTEQLMSLRLIPDVNVLRPGTAAEIAEAWRTALISTDRPTVLILNRGTIGTQGTVSQAKLAMKYGAAKINEQPHAVINLIATGSEVQLALAVSQKLSVASRVISMPNLQQFLLLNTVQKSKIIPEDNAKNVIIEAGTTLGWQALTGHSGLIFGIDRFGMSANPQTILDEYGLNASVIVKKIAQYLEA
ncbi:transketolase family protein [Leuconostoc kimchii]|uniref:transketolase n=2 Tax=Leuconostoc kimchii TaxID=136609 RepID=D5T4M6_LEUKI|nr:transketolase [Leuconostoc kimchii]ADG41497.1 transketolase [Leuconostoc kimchii IMSNU 11154]QBR47699.1 transketolase [Leuconostoc kimchii]